MSASQLLKFSGAHGTRPVQCSEILEHTYIQNHVSKLFFLDTLM